MTDTNTPPAAQVIPSPTEYRAIFKVDGQTHRQFFFAYSVEDVPMIIRSTYDDRDASRTIIYDITPAESLPQPIVRSY